MQASNPKPRRIAVLAHPGIPDALPESMLVASALRDGGVQVDQGSLEDPELHEAVHQKNYDLLIVLGGDGAVLRGGRLCADSNTPILGINLGRFGFLMELQRSDWREFITRILGGEYRYEKRMMLCAEHWRGNSKLKEWQVLNEVVIGRGLFVRPLHLTARVDGYFLTTYVADGVIASTPTGSTAYALAVGGPIMPPELRNILLIPVAPHLSVDRAIILAEGARVSLSVHTDHHAVISVDGQNPDDMVDGDHVDVYAGDHSLSFVRFQDPGYFYRNLTAHMDKNPSTTNEP